MFPKFLLNYLSRLKFPWLFAVSAVIFGIDLMVPDVIPFADEILLGLSTLLLGAWRTRKDEAKTTDEVAKIDESPGDDETM